MGFDVTPCGTVICAKEPWLSASPDGIIDSETLVEVKCPIIAHEENFHDKLENGLCDVVVNVEGKPELQQNGQRGYFMQVQLTMFCGGLKKSLFFVGSEKGHILVDVAYNELYVLDLVCRLKRFYFTSMLPRLADDFREGRLKFCEGYKDIVSK